jgi:23S rRNA maturation mini-RNase III
MLGAIVLAIFVMMVLTYIADRVWDRYVRNPRVKREERIRRLERLAMEQAMTLAVIEPKDDEQGEWGRCGVCKAGFVHLRLDFERLYKEMHPKSEFVEDKIEMIRRMKNAGNKEYKDVHIYPYN